MRLEQDDILDILHEAGINEGRRSERDTALQVFAGLFGPPASQEYQGGGRGELAAGNRK